MSEYKNKDIKVVKIWWVRVLSWSVLPKTTLKSYNKDDLFQIWCNRDYMQRYLKDKKDNWHIYDWFKQVCALWQSAMQ